MDDRTRAADGASSDAAEILSIPGLDAKSGMGRVSGNAALYLSLLRRFAVEQKCAVTRIREALEKGDARGACARLTAARRNARRDAAIRGQACDGRI